MSHSCNILDVNEFWLLIRTENCLDKSVVLITVDGRPYENQLYQIFLLRTSARSTTCRDYSSHHILRTKCINKGEGRIAPLNWEMAGLMLTMPYDHFGSRLDDHGYIINDHLKAIYVHVSWEIASKNVDYHNHRWISYPLNLFCLKFQVTKE